MTAEHYRLIGELFLKAGELGQQEFNGLVEGALRDSPEVRDRLRAMLRVSESNELGTGHGLGLIEHLCASAGRGTAKPGDDIKGLPMPRVKGYALIDKLGEGGMGLVWRAVRLDTDRHFAVKMLNPVWARSQLARARFDREIRLAARMENRHVVRVYDSGECEGLPYYVMPFIEGQDLDVYVRENGLGTQEILTLVRTISLAVDHSHRRGVMHRDLKPSNILVTREGRPVVVDFGLAKSVGPEDVSDLSVEGQYMGTTAYMSPEQAAGRASQTDLRSDIYSLGVILFRLLTGEFPHDTSGPLLEVLGRISDEPVRWPRDINPELSLELEAMLVKALAKDPAQRYASAAELASDIHNHLIGIPLNVRHRPFRTRSLPSRLIPQWMRRSSGMVRETLNRTFL